MLIIYNLLQFFAILLLWPLILFFILIRKKYRTTIHDRLGCGLCKIAPPHKGAKTVWIHALSVGEVTSVLPLIHAVRHEMSNVRIILSVSTSTGKSLAEKIASADVDAIIFPPPDILPLLWFYSKHLKPDLYIHTETDFWPNRLAYLHRKNIPTVLVNGRISQHSLAGYRRFSFFFQPMFTSFQALCMQTDQDRQNMIDLGVDARRAHTLGNLKFDTSLACNNNPLPLFFKELSKKKSLIVAGSTHPGEEKMIVHAFAACQQKQNNSALLLAPRNPKRCSEIEQLILDAGLSVCRRSANTLQESEVILIDTLGELVHFYELATIAFVGGSLIDFGGHNPIEPALMEIPVLFGPYMSDFSEIKNDLLKAMGAIEVKDQYDLETVFSTLLHSKVKRDALGKAALHCVRGQQGVIKKHIDLINTIITEKNL